MNQIADINAFTLFYCSPKNPVVYFFLTNLMSAREWNVIFSVFVFSIIYVLFPNQKENIFSFWKSLFSRTLPFLYQERLEKLYAC